jgi:DNA-binding NtrC family response regulator
MSASVSVLIVEPAAEDRERIATALRGVGVKADIVDTFERARDRLSTATPDVLVTEVRLGAYNGLHLVLRAKAIRPSLKAIVTSRTADRVLQREAHALGAEFFVKESTWLASILSVFRST